MSAEKPEVGDVWEDSKGMVHISRIFTLSDDTRAIVFIDNNNNTVLEDSAREEHFIKMFTYSGKSKASIEDLFCVKENAKMIHKQICVKLMICNTIKQHIRHCAKNG